MSLNSEDDPRIELFLEGMLSPEDAAHFQAEVVADPVLRGRYVERAWLHGQLHAERDLLASLLEEPATMVEPAWYRQPMAWGLAAAAAITVLTASFLFRPAAPVAILAEAEGCKWAGSELPTAQGSKLGAGTLALVEGMATLQFANGATLTLEAPTTLRILDAMHCQLIDGSLVAHVPEPAHGFTVNTPEMKVVDLGTRFGLTTSGLGSSHVLVFEGEVDVSAGAASKRLGIGKSLHLGQSSSPAQHQEVDRAPADNPLAEDGWISLATSAGRGKDAYVRRGNGDRFTGNHPLIQVKHTDLAPENERRSYLTFDLATLGDMNADAAELVLDVEPSGLGFSALVPDSRFGVYGLTNEALDDWSENGLTWENAPAATSTGLDPAQARLLGTFTIRRGAAPAQVQFSSPELLRFLQVDKNRLATFVLIRETGESEVQGLVHAFAAKEHPTARPPTLRLKLSKAP
jgi:ferric-dicitrate binding protein FerR (iron transport regulator)